MLALVWYQADDLRLIYNVLGAGHIDFPIDSVVTDIRQIQRLLHLRNLAFDVIRYLFQEFL